MVCNSHRPQRHCSCPRLLGLNFTLPPTALSRHVWLADSLDSGCQSKLSVLTAESAGDGRRGVFSVILHGKVDWKGRLNFMLSCILLANTFVPDHVWSVDLCTWLHLSILAGTRHANCLEDLQGVCVCERVWHKYSNENGLWKQWCWLIYIQA